MLFSEHFCMLSTNQSPIYSITSQFYNIQMENCKFAKISKYFPVYECDNQNIAYLCLSKNRKELNISKTVHFVDDI